MKGFIGHVKKLTLYSKCSGQSVGFKMEQRGAAGSGLGDTYICIIYYAYTENGIFPAISVTKGCHSHQGCSHHLP